MGTGVLLLMVSTLQAEWENLEFAQSRREFFPGVLQPLISQGRGGTFQWVLTVTRELPKPVIPGKRLPLPEPWASCLCNKEVVAEDLSPTLLSGKSTFLTEKQHEIVERAWILEAV